MGSYFLFYFQDRCKFVTETPAETTYETVYPLRRLKYPVSQCVLEFF